MKIKKGKLLIDQHDKNFMYGGKFGGNFYQRHSKNQQMILQNYLKN